MITEFIKDISKLSGSAVKIFLILYEYRDRSEKTDGWIIASYESLMIYTGLGSSNSIRKGVLELASCGWIRDYERGGYDILNGKRVNRSTKYKLSEEKLSEEDIKDVLKKII